MFFVVVVVVVVVAAAAVVGVVVVVVVVVVASRPFLLGPRLLLLVLYLLVPWRVQLQAFFSGKKNPSPAFTASCSWQDFFLPPHLPGLVLSYSSFLVGDGAQFPAIFEGW